MPFFVCNSEAGVHERNQEAESVHFETKQIVIQFTLMAEFSFALTEGSFLQKT